MQHKVETIEHSGEYRGPLKNRSCTDVPCLLIFVVFVIAWVAVGSFVITNGDARRFLAPTDSEGRKCGIDDRVINAPNLHFFDLSKCLNTKRRCETPQVCVEKCPSSNWMDQAMDMGTSLNWSRSHMICQLGVDVWDKTLTELHGLIDAGKCAKWYLKSTSIFNRCFPIEIPKNFINLTGLTNDKLEEIRKVINVADYAEAIVTTILDSRDPVIGLVVGGALVCLLTIFLLRWLALPFVLLSITVICIALGLLAYYTYERWRSDGDTTWLVITVVIGIILALILLLGLCLIDRIILACQLIEEASEAVMSILSSLFFPIVPSLFHAATIAYAVVVGVYLYTLKIADYRVMYAFVGIHTFGVIWMYCFISALSDMVLASTFATWYWTFRKSDLPFFTLAVGAWRTVRYHLGTVAFGSLLITICRCIRYALEIFRHQNARNWVAYVISVCATYVIRLVEKFFKFMNRNAYIVCAIYGKGLCGSAKDALSLLIRNALRVVVLNNVVSWSLFAGKIFITVLMGATAWSIFTRTKYETEYWWVPTIIVVVGTYGITNVFFNVYEMAVDTIFLCFLEDCERHDGSASKPYYMSYKLRKLLHKE